MSRRVISGAVLMVVLALVAGCGNDPNRKAVAAAKCSLPTDQRLGVPDDEIVRKINVKVEGLGDGRYRVTGFALEIADDGLTKPTPYLCEVAPDSSDMLRGFRVTRLEVGAGAS